MKPHLEAFITLRAFQLELEETLAIIPTDQVPSSVHLEAAILIKQDHPLEASIVFRWQSLSTNNASSRSSKLKENNNALETEVIIRIVEFQSQILLK